MNPSFTLGFAAALLAALLVVPAAASGEAGSAEVREEIARGYDLLERRRADDAVKAFKKANRLADGGSAEALIGLAAAYNTAGAYATGEKTARRGLDLASDPALKLQATNVLAIAVYYRAGDDRERLGEAESLFRSVLEQAGGDLPIAKYNLGEVLLKLGRDDEGLDLLEEYLATDPDGPSAARARSLIDDPRRARQNLVPDFSLVSLDGDYLTPADFAGKVVLFDFWGTWCAPCRAATPHLRSLHGRLAGQPFVMVGVSTDTERAVLEAYVREHEMTWPQVWDERHTVSHDVFRVRSFPTYVLVDHEGRVTLRLSGWSDRIRRTLDVEVGRSVGRATKAAKARPPAG